MPLFVFDLDGTLLDTLADIAGACNTVLSRHGYPQHPVAAYRHMVGNGFEKLAQRALPQDHVPVACEFDNIVQEMRADYQNHMMEQTCPYQGIPESLTELQKKNCFLAVLSNKPDGMTKNLISHYFPDIQFSRIQGAQPGLPLKPDPHSLKLMVDDLGQTVANRYYVGDSDVDMKTALNAHVNAIGAGWGFRGAAELQQAGAKIVLSEPQHIVKILTSRT